MIEEDKGEKNHLRGRQCLQVVKRGGTASLFSEDDENEEVEDDPRNDDAGAHIWQAYAVESVHLRVWRMEDGGLRDTAITVGIFFLQNY